MAFMDENFLLEGKVAQKLYHEYAASLPIIDYHCHISPREVYENRRFDNIAQVWLGGDHYKWRLIRTNGVPENEITGSADDRTKFQRFAEALPLAIGNPMLHWTHLELQRYFGIQKPLTPETAEEIWTECNSILQSGEMDVRNIIAKSNVAMIGTTDDPADDLFWHKKIAEEGAVSAKVLPSFRPDKVVNIEKPDFADAVKHLGEVVGYEISSVKLLKKALTERLDYFCLNGCKASDHGMDAIVYRGGTEDEIEEAFGTAMEKKTLKTEQIEMFRTAMLRHLAAEYAKRGIVMQIHYGVQRNTNTKVFRAQGADMGFDTIAGGGDGIGMVRFLDSLAQEDALPKTVIYSLDPKDNELIDTIIGSYQTDECRAKIQHGSAWWFNDTKSGMENHLKSLANLSILGNFIGMLTDSRSFLSYTRHEYFRRILCNFIGKLVENGEYPDDQASLKRIVEGISYYNAKEYFDL